MIWSCSLCCKLVFHSSFSPGWFCRFLHECQDPGAVLVLAAGMPFGVVGFFLGDDAKEDFKQALTETAQSAGMALTLVAFFAGVGVPPTAGSAEEIGLFVSVSGPVGA